METALFDPGAEDLRLLAIGVQGIADRWPNSKAGLDSIAPFLLYTGRDATGNTSTIVFRKGPIRKGEMQFIRIGRQWRKSVNGAIGVRVTIQEVEKAAALYFTKPYLVEHVSDASVLLAKKLMERA